MTVRLQYAVVKIAESEMGDLDPFGAEGASECFEGGNDGRFEAVVG